MKQFSANEIRTAFLDFFSNKQHHLLPSASLVPIDDPSLLWINSGVATLKHYFDGRKTPINPRIANSQKSIRTNDIENVGYTTRHHTFFEMLGNFSIGDYFKEEAIFYAWEFLTSPQWLSLDPAKLYITIFSEDQEAYDIWKNKIKVVEDHIILGNRKTNFWDMGEGPCGPNSEIFYDRGYKYDPENKGITLLKEDLENDRYIEIWNIVFSQFNNDGQNNYQELPRKNIDTGAGLERIATIVQDVPTNFDNDLFLPIIREIEHFTHFKYDTDNYFHPETQQTKINVAFKIIADHIRTLTFAISDGACPSNKDRGYVLRRLLRRSVVYGQKLGIEQPFLFQLVKIVTKIMGNHYSELLTKQLLISEVIQQEEQRFWKTLKIGEELLKQELQSGKTLSADFTFKLFDTYGYPLELTLELAQEALVKVDVQGFQIKMEEHRKLARASRNNVFGMSSFASNFLENLPQTPFVGYEQEAIQTTIIALIKDKQLVNALVDEAGYLVLAKTPFYAEKGGQAPDDGIIFHQSGRAQVYDVQEKGHKQVLHSVQVEGTLALKDLVNAQVNQDHRKMRKKNHSGTHLLHSALREVLGSHVMQSGSFNSHEYLRMDFTHNKSISKIDLQRIDELIQKWILMCVPCEVINSTYKEALEMNALAFFGEKYDNQVRIVKFGDFSIELCGGTHCHNTGEIEELLITGVESKGAGSFRISAITSFKAIQDYIKSHFSIIREGLVLIENDIRKCEKTISVNSKQNIQQLILKLKSLPEKKANMELATTILAQIRHEFKKIVLVQKTYQDTLIEQKYHKLTPLPFMNYQILLIDFQEEKPQIVQNLTQYFQKKYPNLFICLVNFFPKEQQTLLTIALSADLKTKFQANKILKQLLLTFSGNGGGSDQLSQGKINQIIDKNIIFTLFRSIIETWKNI